MREIIKVSDGAYLVPSYSEQTVILLGGVKTNHLTHAECGLGFWGGR